MKKSGTDQEKRYEVEPKQAPKRNAWKRYGVLVMTGVLLAGSATGAGFHSRSVFAEEETEKRITLNVAGDDDEEEAVTEAQETETETETEAVTEKETFAQLDSVESGSGAIVTTDVSGIVEACMPSIVSITEKSVQEIEMNGYGVQEYESSGSASGVIVAQNDEELLIATNYHVIADATEVSVGFSVEAENEDDLIVPAKVKGSDSKTELAVVAVQLSDIPEEVRSQLKIATLGSSDSLKVGQAAIAIGNSLGYGQSVTSGIISALNKEVTIDNFTGNLIQTDAAINFGNSGGALLNANGEVIGISVAKEVGTSSENMGYAIPIDTAIPVLEQLINRETRDKVDAHGYMGISVVNVVDDAYELYSMPVGAYVYSVTEGSAADIAGINKGDIITEFDGVEVTSSDDLVDLISYYAVGETVTVEVQTANGGEYVSHEVEVTLQEGTSSSEEQTEENNSDEEQYEMIPGNGDIQVLPFSGENENGSF
jgi:serine protease Do